MDIFSSDELSVGSVVLTEIGVLLGWFKKVGVAEDTNSGNKASLIISSIPLWIPEMISSAYALSVEEVICSGHDRLIVFVGAEERVKVLRIGLLERLGICNPPRKAYSPAGYSWKGKWNDEDDRGFSHAAVPRRPNPPPTDSAVEAEVKADGSAVSQVP